MNRLFWMISIITLLGCEDSPPPTLLESILDHGDVSFKKVVQQKEDFEIQILFSPIDRREDSIVVTDHFFNFRPDEYFYPASTVKMPVAFLALQKLEEMRQSGLSIDRDTRMKIDSLRPPQRAVTIDSTAAEYAPSIGHYINKLFAVSDNDAYNRLYEYTTQDYINSHLRNKKIFTNSRIVHRVGVSGFSFEENKFTPSMSFIDQDGETIVTLPEIYAQSHNLTLVSNTLKGKAYIDQKGNKIEEPFDFGRKNYINIKDLQESLKRFILPELYLPSMQYKISEEDRAFLMESMAKLPKEYDFLDSKENDYYDSYVKFFLFGDSKDSIPEHIEIRNKVGYAYGYLTDCAYIKDTKEDLEYFLTATIHVNENETYNDGEYEYDEIGVPFLAQLGRLVHQYMIDEKKHKQ